MPSVRILKNKEKHLLNQVVNKFYGKNRKITYMGGMPGEVEDNYRLVKDYVRELEKNKSFFSAKVFKENLEKPMGLLAKYDKYVRMKQGK